jgi:hypothetical protein
VKTFHNLLALAAVLALVSIAYFHPTISENERVYLTPGRQLLDPQFLANDWTVGSQSGANFGLLFSGLAAVLWAVTKDALTVTLISRWLVWIIAASTLLYLSRVLKIRRWVFVLGVAVWLYSSQNLMAGEWLFGPAEQKVVAYAFLFLALAAAWYDKLLLAGLSLGAAVAFHVLVGGWGAVALAGALLVQRGWSCVKPLWKLALGSAVSSAPMIAYILSFMLSPGARTARTENLPNADALLVQFRIPHHADPAYFLSPRAVAIGVLFLGASLWAITRLFPKERARLLAGFLGFVVAIFLAGLLSRGVGWFWPLKFYPFRVGDVLIPLFFWILVPEILLRSSTWAACFRGARVRGMATLAALVLLSGAMGWKVLGATGDAYAHANYLRSTWQEHRRAQTSPFSEMARWIRDNLPQDAVVAVFPCESSFWLEAERAMVVTFKWTPHDARFSEWYRRMVDLNGGKPFEDRGLEVCSGQSFKENFESLSADSLRHIEQSYGANFYLTDRERPEVDEAEVHAQSALFLYRLN